MGVGGLELEGSGAGCCARAGGLREAVAEACKSHYQPLGRSDEVPAEAFEASLRTNPSWTLLASKALSRVFLQVVTLPNAAHFSCGDRLAALAEEIKNCPRRTSCGSRNLFCSPRSRTEGARTSLFLRASKVGIGIVTWPARKATLEPPSTVLL